MKSGSLEPASSVVSTSVRCSKWKLHYVKTLLRGEDNQHTTALKPLELSEPTQTGDWVVSNQGCETEKVYLTAGLQTVFTFTKNKALSKMLLFYRFILVKKCTV